MAAEVLNSDFLGLMDLGFLLANDCISCMMLDLSGAIVLDFKFLDVGNPLDRLELVARRDENEAWVCEWPELEASILLTINII